jgi:hypothetical protein
MFQRQLVDVQVEYLSLGAMTSNLARCARFLNAKGGRSDRDRGRDLAWYVLLIRIPPCTFTYTIKSMLSQYEDRLRPCCCPQKMMVEPEFRGIMWNTPIPLSRSISTQTLSLSKLLIDK